MWLATKEGNEEPLDLLKLTAMSVTSCRTCTMLVHFLALESANLLHIFPSLGILAWFLPIAKIEGMSLV